MEKKELVLKLLSINIRNVLSKLNQNTFNNVQEVRLRTNAPIIVIYKNREYFITNNGELTDYRGQVYIVEQREIRETMEYISNFSMYAFEDEIRQGFLTVAGGHRVGLAGKVIIEDGKIKNIKHISFINIRIASEVKGCADKVIPYLYNDDKEFYHTLIISPPRCGKTTMLRDIVRQVSNGEAYVDGLTVGVVDERSEIGGCYLGVPQNDLGIRTDILDCCPKAEGMLMLIRSMSPKILAVDEIGSSEDIEAIEYVINSGCKLICTVHGNSIEDIRKKPILNKLVEKQIFERYIVLSNKKKIGQVVGLYDESTKPVGTQLRKGE